MGVDLLRRWAPWALRGTIAVALALFLPTVDWRGFAATVRQVPAGTLMAGAGCALVNLFGKGTNLWLLLEPSARPRLATLWGLVLRAAAASIVMPFRAGEGLRLLWLSALTGRPLPTLLAVAVGEKSANLVSLTVLVVLAAAFVPLPAGWAPQAGMWLAASSLLLAGGIVAAIVFRRRLGAIGAAASSLAGRGVATWASVLGCALLGWLGDCSLVWLMAHATGTPVPWAATPLVLLAINVAIALPGTPGHVGTMELAAVTALSAFGASREAALGFATLYHAVQLLAVMALAGLHLACCRLAPERPSPAPAAPPTGRPPGR